VERTQPNGVVTSHQYDELSQILEIEHRKSDNTVISAFDYDYDQAGNIVSVTEADSSAFKYE
jgi:YD repeat-containing protein